MTAFFSGVTILVDCGDIIERFSAPVAALELGLRWLHDRCEEDNQSNFVDVIKGAFPSIMTTSFVASIMALELGLRWLHDRGEPGLTPMRWVHDRGSAPIMALELGLRWLHDRGNDLSRQV